MNEERAILLKKTKRVKRKRKRTVKDKGKETMQDSTLRALVDLRDKQIQKARIQFGNRLGAIERQDDNTTDRQQQIVERWLNRFSQLESELDQDIEAAAGEYGVYFYVTEIKGIGPLLAANSLP